MKRFAEAFVFLKTQIFGVGKRRLLMVSVIVLTGLAFQAVAENKTKIDKVYVKPIADAYSLDVVIHYEISATAKEAIQKGVPLSWVLRIQLQQEQFLWCTTLYEQRQVFVIQYHALLNLYSVRNLATEEDEKFASFNAAIDYLSHVNNVVVPAAELRAGENYRLALKIEFDREFLPIPLRPVAYFKTDWALSSDWLIWHLQKK